MAMNSDLTGLGSRVSRSPVQLCRERQSSARSGPWELVFLVPLERYTLQPLSELGQAPLRPAEEGIYGPWGIQTSVL